MATVEQPSMIDVTCPKGIKVRIRADGRVLWVNIDGACRLRVCEISPGTLVVVDDRPMAAKRKRVRRFVVGYKETVYGRRRALSPNRAEFRFDDYCDSMTRQQADKARMKLACSAVIYELVERP